MTTFAGHILTGTLAARPAASSVPAGTLYSSTTDGTVYQSSGSSWGTWLAAPAAAAGVAADTIWDTKGDLAIASGADAASKLPVGTNNQVLTADSAQTLGVKWATPAAGGSAWTLLSTTTIAGSAGGFDVSSISGAYNDLLVVAILRGSFASANIDTKIQFNNDSGSNYLWQVMNGTGSSAVAQSSSGAVTEIRIGHSPANTATAGFFGVFEIWIPGYASTTWNKTVNILNTGGSSTGTTAQWAEHLMGMWTSTAAINRIQVNTGSGNCAIGSTLRIYGRT